MASIAKRPDGKYRARYRDHRGKEHARHFNRKVDAQNWLDKVTASKVRGDYVDPKDSATLFEGYAKRWFDSISLSDSTMRMYDSYLNKHIYPALGGVKIGVLRRTDIQVFVTSLTKKGLAPNTVKSIYGVLRLIFDAAVHDRLIAFTPCTRIVLPRVATEKMVIPTKEQVASLISSMPDYAAPLVVTLAGTGMRIGEALGLMVSDVDLERRTINIERQRSTKTRRIGKTKTPSSVRIVPIGEVVTEALRPIVEDRPQDDWLFVNSFGEPLGYATWADNFRRLKIPYTTHDLRHFAASALISGGASVKQVQEFLGHATATITLNTYSHLWPGDEDRTRSVLDAALSGLPAPSAASEAVPGSLHAEAAS